MLTPRRAGIIVLPALILLILFIGIKFSQHEKKIECKDMWIAGQCIDPEKGPIQVFKIFDIYKFKLEYQHDQIYVEAIFRANNKSYNTGVKGRHIILIEKDKFISQCQDVLQDRKYPIRLVGQGTWLPSKDPSGSNTTDQYDFKLDSVISCTPDYIRPGVNQLDTFLHLEYDD